MYLQDIILIHFAVAKPLEYYDNNVVGTLTLLEVMKIVFSYCIWRSTYNANKRRFSNNKIFYRRDLYISDNDFNPVGAHKSGEDPNNLMPFISQVAVGKREFWWHRCERLYSCCRFSN